MARIDRLDEIGRLGIDALGGLLLAPRGLDLRLGLVQGPLPGRIDGRHLEPDRAPIGRRDGVVVDADVGGEGGLQQVLLVDEVRGGSAGSIEPCRVDGIDRAGFETDGARGLRKRLAGGARILDAVAKRLGVRIGTARGDLALQRRFDLGEGLQIGGLHGGDVDQNSAERALDGIARRVDGKAERRVGYGMVEDLILGHRSEVDRLLVELAFLHDIVEGRARLDASRGRSGLTLRRKHDLLHGPGLGRAISRVLDLFIECHRVGIRYRIGFGEGRGRDRQHDELSVLRGHEGGLVGIVIGLERRAVGGRDLASRRGRQDHGIETARLGRVAMQRVDGSRRRRHPADQSLHELLPQIGLALVADEALFVEAVVPQHGIEPGTVEAAARSREGRIGEDRSGHPAVRDPETQGLGTIVEGRVRHQARQDLHVEAQTVGLVVGDLPTRPLLQVLQLRLIGLPVSGGRDADSADLRDLVAAAAAEHVADAPHHEGQHDEPEHERHDGLADPRRLGGPYAFEHGRFSCISIGGRRNAEWGAAL